MKVYTPNSPPETYITFRLLGKWLEAHQDLSTACKLDYDDTAYEWLKEVEPNVSISPCLFSISRTNYSVFITFAKSSTDISNRSFRGETQSFWGIGGQDRVFYVGGGKIIYDEDYSNQAKVFFY